MKWQDNTVTLKMFVLMSYGNKAQVKTSCATSAPDVEQWE